MPRDLFPALTKSPKNIDPTLTTLDGNSNSSAHSAETSSSTGSNSASRQLHPFTQILTSSNVNSCTRLEELAFPPEERATHEKFAYRLKVCPELCLGIFTSGAGSTEATAATATPVDSSEPQRKAILLGHIVSTKSLESTVTDDDMAYPTDANTNPNLGHKEQGRTICLHSLAVLPNHQKQKLGSTLMQDYIQRMASSGVADRIALIAHDYLVGYYERFGFRSLGPSKAQFGGGGWYDMVLELEPQMVAS